MAVSRQLRRLARTLPTKLHHRLLAVMLAMLRGGQARVQVEVASCSLGGAVGVDFLGSTHKLFTEWNLLFWGCRGWGERVKEKFICQDALHRVAPKGAFVLCRTLLLE